MLTHDHLAFIVNNHIADLMPGLSSNDAALVLAPLSHGAGVHVLTHVARGAAIVLLPGDSFDATEAWSLIARHRVSTMFTVPTILNRLVAAVGDDTDRSSLRQVIYAGAPITQQDQRRAFEVLGPVIEQYYGLAEVTGAITVLPPEAHADAPTYEGIVTAGYPRTGMTISIQDPDGNPRSGRRRAGRDLRRAGRRSSPATWRTTKPTQERSATAGSAPVTSAFVDERGLLYITGRASDMYISGGSNIDPREVEEKILAHPNVRRGRRRRRAGRRLGRGRIRRRAWSRTASPQTSC